MLCILKDLTISYKTDVSDTATYDQPFYNSIVSINCYMDGENKVLYIIDITGGSLFEFIIIDGVFITIGEDYFALQSYVDEAVANKADKNHIHSDYVTTESFNTALGDIESLLSNI